jgi:hypothetical protein
LKVNNPNEWLISMNYEWVNTENIEKGGGNYKITLIGSFAFAVDSNVENGNKNYYVLSFTQLLVILLLLLVRYHRTI